MDKVLLIIGIILVLIGVIMLIKKLKKHSINELEITKVISAGIPFKWEFEIEDSSIIEYANKYVIKDENKGGIVGAKVHTNYVFKGLKEGKTNIIFKLVNFTNNQVDTVDKHLVIVDTNLNIKEVIEKDG